MGLSVTNFVFRPPLSEREKTDTGRLILAFYRFAIFMIPLTVSVVAYRVIGTPIELTFATITLIIAGLSPKIAAHNAALLVHIGLSSIIYNLRSTDAFYFLLAYFAIAAFVSCGIVWWLRRGELGRN